MDTPPPLDAAVMRRLAVKASCDPRTIAKIATGKPVRGLAAERARAALTAAGYKVPAAVRVGR